MKQGMIAQVFLSGPSDVVRHLRMAAEVIRQWNILTLKQSSPAFIHAVIGPSDTEGGIGQEAQAFINPNVKDCDLLFAFFWTRLGTPTNNYDSGTAEEISEFVDMNGGDRAVVFVCESAPDDEVKVDDSEQSRLRKFLNEIKPKSLFVPFSTDLDFALNFRRQLDFKMKRVLESLPTTTSTTTTTTPDPNRATISTMQPIPPEWLTDDAGLIEALKVAASTPRATLPELRSDNAKALVRLLSMFTNHWQAAKANDDWRGAFEVLNDLLAAFNSIRPPKHSTSDSLGNRFDAFRDDLATLADDIDLNPNNQLSQSYFWRTGDGLRGRLLRLAEMVDMTTT